VHVNLDRGVPAGLKHLLCVDGDLLVTAPVLFVLPSGLCSRKSAGRALSASGAGVRFGLSRFAQSSSDWRDKGRLAEQCGFDVLWAPDHLFHFSRPDEPVLDGWVTLAAWAATTTRIRVGMLITNLSWRPPVLVARAAAALDQVSDGRFELGIGAGAFADQAMAGMLDMSPRERVARLAEGVGVIDRLLRGDLTRCVEHLGRRRPASGRILRCYAEKITTPRPVLHRHRPRPFHATTLTSRLSPLRRRVGRQGRGGSTHRAVLCGGFHGVRLLLARRGSNAGVRALHWTGHANMAELCFGTAIALTGPPASCP
jgi:Luciferase-like monooxygenase